MRIKSYFAGTVEAAMELARKELGEEAVLLNSRPAPPEARHLGVHEVVFGVEVPALSEREVAGAVERERPLAGTPARWPAERGSERGTERGTGADLGRVLARIERRLELALLAPGSDPSAARGGSPLIRYLLTLGYSESFAAEVCRRTAEGLARGTREPLPFREWPRPVQAGLPAVARFADAPGLRAADFANRGEAARALVAAFAELCPVEEEPPDRRVVAFVGPPGAGRTSLVAKIAARACAWDQIGTTILTCDTVRIGAADQLRTYAGIMGAAFEIHETPRAMARAVAEQSSRRLVVIDTPGWSPAQLADPGSGAAPWQEAFASGALGAEVHLVLPASLNTADMGAMEERFRCFGPSFLAWTRLDEAVRSAPLAAFSASCGLPLSWFGFGQSVPEDLEPASRERWLDLALEEEPLGGVVRAMESREEVNV